MPKSKTFLKLKKKVGNTYLGKPVPKKYQKKYGKRYDSSEIDSLSYAISKSRGVKID